MQWNWSLVWAQETVYMSTSALRRQTTRHKRQCQCRPPTTRDFKGSCRCLSGLSRGAQPVIHDRAIRCFASFKCTVFVHWLSARWTTANRFLLASPAICRTGCSPSWMPPPVWFSQRDGQNAWPHYFVNSIGWEFRSESHSGWVFWPTAVITKQCW